MNRLKQWDEKLNQAWERVSRGKRLALNLVLCALFSLGIWIRLGCPLSTVELEFRRLERTHLLPRSEIVFNSKEHGPIQWRDLPGLEIFNTDLVVGVGEELVYVADLRYRTVDCRPLEEGITPVPMYNLMAMCFTPGDIHSGVALLFLHVPEEVQRAEIEIDAEDFKGEALHYQGEGWRLEPGMWIFSAYPGDSYNGSWYENGAYTLTLYREDGSLLLEQSGTLEK